MHFTSSLIIGFAIAAFHLGSVASLGINCRGSFYCGLNGQIGQTNPLTSLSDTIVNGIDPNRHYNDGEQIACGHFPPQGDANSEPVQPLCVFCQYSSGASGSLIASLIPQLVDHG